MEPQGAGDLGGGIPAARRPGQSARSTGWPKCSRRNFATVFRGSPVRRAKLSGLRRNAVIAMGNSGDEKFVPTLKKIGRGRGFRRCRARAVGVGKVRRWRRRETGQAPSLRSPDRCPTAADSQQRTTKDEGRAPTTIRPSPPSQASAYLSNYNPAMFQNDLLFSKRILITGGGTGLGKAAAQRFLELGAEVYICGRREEVLRATERELRERTGGRIHRGPAMCATRSRSRR